MEFQVLDVDYVMVNEKPVIRVFGKDSRGETVCGFYEGFTPYFYVTGTGVAEKLKGNPQVLAIEKVNRCLPLGYQEPSEVHKITLRNPAKTPDLREMLRDKGYVPYEADILFKYRWMNDIGIGGMKWVRTTESNGISTNSVTTERKIQMKHVEALEKDEDAPLRYLALDIETVSDDESKMPEAVKDPIVMISLVFEPGYMGRKSMILSTRSGEGIEPCSDERDMLNKLVEIINEYDPDVITGFNINNFDMPYIIDRMRKNNVKPVFGRCTSKYVRYDKFANRYKITIIGRVIADSFQIVKTGWNLKRYGLDFVSKELLNEEKGDVKKSEIGKLWRGTHEEFKKLASYNLKDSVLAMNLLLKLKLLDKYVALSKISGSLLNDILGGGEIQRIENYLLREFNMEGYILPSKSQANRAGNGGDDKKDSLKGGFVLEPKRGIHSMVLVLDFKSMYPSLIRTYNICPTTLVKDEGMEDVITTPIGAKFVSKKTRYGIMPRILENLRGER
jgi:DNA polymerase I